MKYLFIFFIISNSKLLFADQWYWGCNPDNDIINAFDSLDTECEKIAFLDSLYTCSMIATKDKFKCRTFNKTISNFLNKNIFFAIQIVELDSSLENVFEIKGQLINNNRYSGISVKIDTLRNLYIENIPDTTHIVFLDSTLWYYRPVDLNYKLQEKYYFKNDCRLLHTLDLLFRKLLNFEPNIPGHFIGKNTSSWNGIVDDCVSHLEYIQKLKALYHCQ